ncbi:MAG: lamin tail domain-containing protein [Akkermansiaceae bacterium]|nr:lamin tail domain-containing protein [Akkermansiaceae bacterium]
MKATAFFVACLAPCSATAVDPVVTELMADNRDTIGLPEVNGPDWIEIHNPGGSAIDLAGWHLTDNAQALDQWTFPAGATIASGGYLIVYASGLDMIGGGEYHTNFGLSDQGEYLALVQPGGTVVQEFAPSYPQQYPDISYGLTSGGTNAYFTSPTPGSPNNASVQGFVQDTTFSHDRGFYDASFELQVTTATPGATIYYTTDGSTPDETSSFVDAPDPASLPILTLTIPTTTIVRAYAVKTGYESTNVDTQTYVFPDHVLTRRNLSSSITQHATWGPLMRDALLEIPSISLVTQEDIPNTNPSNPSEIYLDPAEVHVSIEMMFPDGRDGFQHNAAIERFGGQ